MQARRHEGHNNLDSGSSRYINIFSAEEVNTQVSSRRGFFRSTAVAGAAALTAAASPQRQHVPTAWASDSSSSLANNNAFSDDSSLDLFYPQFSTVDDVPPDYFDKRKAIYAFVERIIDGDTIRVRHIPGYRLLKTQPEPLQQRGIAKDTLSIRIYGVDCPETAKPNRPQSVDQQFGPEAKDYTSAMVYHQMVKVTFLRKDQYNRAIAKVETLGGDPYFFSGSRDLSVELARQGLAELYRGGGAEYAGNLDVLREVIAEARVARRGIWSLGDARVSAAEFKRAQKLKQPPPQSPNSAPDFVSSSYQPLNHHRRNSRGLFARLWVRPRPNFKEVHNQPTFVAGVARERQSVKGSIKRGETAVEKVLDVVVTGLELINV